MQCHPDKISVDAGSDDLFKQISEAYRILMDGKNNKIDLIDVLQRSHECSMTENLLTEPWRFQFLQVISLIRYLRIFGKIAIIAP